MWLGIMADIKTRNAQRPNTFLSTPSTWKRVQGYIRISFIYVMLVSAMVDERAWENISMDMPFISSLL